MTAVRGDLQPTLFELSHAGRGGGKIPHPPADALLLCATELTTSGDIARFVAAFQEVLSGRPSVGVETGAGDTATPIGATR